MKRLLLFALAFVTSASALAGTFTEIRPGVWKYEGQIVKSDVGKWRDILADNHDFSLTIDSGGGSLAASIALGKLTRNNSERVQITVKDAYSGAALWAVGDDDYRFFDEDSFLAFHLPYYQDWYAPDKWDWMLVGYEIGCYLSRTIGGEKADALMVEMANVGYQYKSTNAYIVWRRDNRNYGERVGDRWSFDPEKDDG